MSPMSSFQLYLNKSNSRVNEEVGKFEVENKKCIMNITFCKCRTHKTLREQFRFRSIPR